MATANQYGLFVLCNGEWGLYRLFPTRKGAEQWATRHISWTWKIDRVTL
jgi:hypothetical protein